MKPFQLFPTEALLLGQCLGEYEFGPYDAQKPRTYFTNICSKRLGPYCETLHAEERAPVSDDMIPNDIQWRDGHWGRYGWSITSKDTFFDYDEDGTLYRTTWQTSRSSLVDLLNSYLGEAVGRTLADDAFLPLREDLGRLAFDKQSASEVSYTRFLKAREASEKHFDMRDSPFYRPDNPDDTDRVRNLLFRLAQDSDCWNTHILGYWFGMAIAGCHNLAEIFHENVEEPRKAWFGNFAEQAGNVDAALTVMQDWPEKPDPIWDSLESLIKNHLPQGGAARFEYLDYDSAVDRDTDQDPYDDSTHIDLRRSMALVREFQEKAWLCFGSILGYLRAGNSTR